MNVSKKQRLITYTNNRLDKWYYNAKIDYGIEGSGKATIEDGFFKISYTENGEQKKWQMAYHEQDLHEIGYYFEVWAENAN